MRCPKCDNPTTEVLQTRAAGPHHTPRRQRHCTACSERFTTVELFETDAGLRVSADEHARMTGLLNQLTPAEVLLT